MKFTDAKIRNLKPKDKRYELWEGNGLGIRVSPAGRKSWVFCYRYSDRSRRMTLGTYPAVSVGTAHAKHGEALRMLENGSDPGEEHVTKRKIHRASPTITQLSEHYMEMWAKPRKRSWKHDEYILNKYVIPAYGNRKAKEIRRRDIVSLLDSIAFREINPAPIMANRTLEVVRKMYNFAISRDIIETSPCVMVTPPGKVNRRDRILDTREIRYFWHNLKEAKMSEATRIALRLQLVTAQRRGEIATMKWDHIDIGENWWTIPAELSKNGLAHRVPLSPLAIELLQQAKKLSYSSEYVFPSPTRNTHVTPRSLSRAIGNNRKLFGIDAFTSHDLRRTAASQMASMGISRLVIAKILNHADNSVTAVYDRHSYDPEKRKSLTDWSNQLRFIITSKNTQQKYEQNPGNMKYSEDVQLLHSNS